MRLEAKALVFWQPERDSGETQRETLSTPEDLLTRKLKTVPRDAN